MNKQLEEEQAVRRQASSYTPAGEVNYRQKTLQVVTHRQKDVASSYTPSEIRCK